jgi:hypothetical protein
VLVLRGSHVQLFLSGVNLVVLNNSSDDFADIFFTDHSIEKRCDSIELSVGGVVVPGDCGHGIFRLEKVGYWRIIHDYDVLHGTSQSRQVLHECVVEESTVLSEQEVRAHLLRVKVLHQGLCVFRETRSEDYELVYFVHSFKELGDERPHKNVDCADLTIDLDWKHDISTFHRFERGVDKGLIQVEDKSFATSL